MQAAGIKNEITAIKHQVNPRFKILLLRLVFLINRHLSATNLLAAIAIEERKTALINLIIVKNLIFRVRFRNLLLRMLFQVIWVNLLKTY